MRSLRDMIVSYPRGWLLYAMGLCMGLLCICYLCVPTRMLTLGSMAWLSIWTIMFDPQTHEPGATYNLASQREVLAMTVMTCLRAGWPSRSGWPSRASAACPSAAWRLSLRGW